MLNRREAQKRIEAVETENRLLKDLLSKISWACQGCNQILGTNTEMCDDCYRCMSCCTHKSQGDVTA